MQYFVKCFYICFFYKWKHTEISDKTLLLIIIVLYQIAVAMWELYKIYDHFILLNAYMTCRYSWRYQLQEFSGNFHTVALDLRGCGDSDAPDRLDEYSLDTLLYDIRDTIDELGTHWLDTHSPWPHIMVGQIWGRIVDELLTAFLHSNDWTHAEHLLNSAWVWRFNIDYHPTNIHRIIDDNTKSYNKWIFLRH